MLFRSTDPRPRVAASAERFELRQDRQQKIGGHEHVPRKCGAALQCVADPQRADADERAVLVEPLAGSVHAALMAVQHTNHHLTDTESPIVAV